jgi:hypothetical protein
LNSFSKGEFSPEIVRLTPPHPQRPPRLARLPGGPIGRGPAFFDGVEIVSPGITPVTEWRPEDPPEKRTPVGQASMYAAVARKP